MGSNKSMLNGSPSMSVLFDSLPPRPFNLPPLPFPPAQPSPALITEGEVRAFVWLPCGFSHTNWND